MAITPAEIAAAGRILTPIFSELIKGAKGTVQRELRNWEAPGKIKKIARSLIKLENVYTLWSPDKETPLHNFYYPSKLQIDGENETVSCISDLPPGNLTIQGIVGQGKSIFMRYLASQAIRERDSTKLPIFLELRTISSKLTLRQAIFRALQSYDVEISEETFDYLARSGKVTLLLDGFDEVQDDLVRETIHEIDYLSSRFPDMKIIVSSRPGNEIQKISGFRILEIAQLEPSDIPPFLERLGLNSVKRDDLLQAIRESENNVGEIIRTPLMLTLIVLVYESEREIPPTLPEFFERLFQVVFTRHDRLKAGFARKHNTGLSERRLQLLFEAFCFVAMQRNYGRSLLNRLSNTRLSRIVN